MREEEPSPNASPPLEELRASPSPWRGKRSCSCRVSHCHASWLLMREPREPLPSWRRGTRERESSRWSPSSLLSTCSCFFRTDGRREPQVPSISRRTRLLTRVFFCRSRFHSFSLMLEMSTKSSTFFISMESAYYLVLLIEKKRHKEKVDSNGDAQLYCKPHFKKMSWFRQKTVNLPLFGEASIVSLVVLLFFVAFAIFWAATTAIIFMDWPRYSLAGVYLAERLNTVLRMNWKSFSSQNYFDPNGLFMSVLWSEPLLVIAMIILASLNGSGAVTSSVPNSSAFFGSGLKKVHQESLAATRFPPEASRLRRSMRTSRQIRTDGKGWPMISQMTSKISQEGRVFCSF